MYRTVSVYLISFLCAMCFIAMPKVYAKADWTTGDVSITDKYSYRLLTRKMAMSPNKFVSDNVRPLSEREFSTFAATSLRAENRREDTLAQAKQFQLIPGQTITNHKDFFSPFNELSVASFATSDQNTVIPSNFGEIVNGYQSSTVSFNGRFNVHGALAGFYEVKIRNDIDENTYEFSRFQLKKGFKNVSVAYSKDYLVLGPGMMGNLLLSNNAQAHDMVMLKTEYPYHLGWLGKLRWYLWHAWFESADDQYFNSNLLGLRIASKITKNIEFAINRLSYVGNGSNRSLGSVSDLWKIATAEDENVRSSLNSDQLAGVDLSFYIPVRSQRSPVKGIKLYTERVWNDFQAFWQEDDKKDGVLFNLLGTSFLYGAFFTTGRLDFNFEYVKTTELIYAHSSFSQYGASVNGYLLGHHIGRDARAYLFDAYYELTKKIHVSSNLGYIERGIRQQKSQFTQQIGFGLHYFVSTELHLELELNQYSQNRTDINPSPIGYRFTEDNNSYIQGLVKLSYYL